MSSRADTERAALVVLEEDLRQYATRMGDARAAVEAGLRRAESHVEAAVNEARGALARAMERLRECESSETEEGEPRDCSWLAAEADRAKARLELAYSVRQQVAQLRADHRPASIRVGTMLEALGQQARRELQRAGGALEVYLEVSTGSGGGAGAGVGGRGGPRSGGGQADLQPPAGFPPEVVMVPLSMIDDFDSHVTGPESFGKGYSPADLEWALEAFHRVVMPALAQGAGIDEFRARDAREGRMGTRSYADTYSNFLGSDERIRLDAAGGTLAVANGYHRIWVARRMGLDAVPAEVVGL